MFGGLKNSRTFASLSKGSTSENRGFGEVAEWSIAAVLKTVVLRGTGGSNPSLSARKHTKSESYPERLTLFLFYGCYFFVVCNFVICNMLQALLPKKYPISTT